MPDNPFTQLTFKELHLFPRALFVFGVGCIAEGMIRQEPLTISLGIACFFGAVGINILYDLRRSKGDEAIRIRTEKRWMRGFCVAAFVLSFSLSGCLVMSSVIRSERLIIPLEEWRVVEWGMACGARARGCGAGSAGALRPVRASRSSCPFDGRRERHGPRDTPQDHVWTGTRPNSALNRVRIGRSPLLSGAGRAGAEWRWVDFEVGRSARGALHKPA